MDFGTGGTAMVELTAGRNDAGQRLDKFLSLYALCPFCLSKQTTQLACFFVAVSIPKRHFILKEIQHDH